MKQKIVVPPRWVYLLIAIHYLLSHGTYCSRLFGFMILNTFMVFLIIYAKRHWFIWLLSLAIIVGTLLH
jgi:hypothetical protein